MAEKKKLTQLEEAELLSKLSDERVLIYGEKKGWNAAPLPSNPLHQTFKRYQTLKQQSPPQLSTKKRFTQSEEAELLSKLNDEKILIFGKKKNWNRGIIPEPYLHSAFNRFQEILLDEREAEREKTVYNDTKSVDENVDALLADPDFPNE